MLYSVNRIDCNAIVNPDNQPNISRIVAICIVPAIGTLAIASNLPNGAGLLRKERIIMTKTKSLTAVVRSYSGGTDDYYAAFQSAVKAERKAGKTWQDIRESMIDGGMSYEEADNFLADAFSGYAREAWGIGNTARQKIESDFGKHAASKIIFAYIG